jgi:hypothetical protein
MVSDSFVYAAAGMPGLRIFGFEGMCRNLHTERAETDPPQSASIEVGAGATEP